MSELWTPQSSDPRSRPKVSAETESLVRQWEAQVLSMMHQEGGILTHWNVELQKIDRNLRLMQATPLAVAPGVKAGYYHLVRLRDPAEGTFMFVQPLQGPSGEFVEPTSQMLDVLRWADMQSDQVIRGRQHNDERERASKEREIEREREERLDYGMELYKAGTRTQILTSSDVPYSQNNSKTARRARAEKIKKGS